MQSVRVKDSTLRQKLLLLFVIGVLVSCKKDQPCSGIDFSQNDREVFVGKWRWYKSTVTEWLDVGPDVFRDYMPATEGFEYHITLSIDGKLPLEFYHESEKRESVKNFFVRE